MKTEILLAIKTSRKINTIIDTITVATKTLPTKFLGYVIKYNESPVINKNNPTLREIPSKTRINLTTERSSVKVIPNGKSPAINKKIQPRSCKKCLLSFVLEYISKDTIAPIKRDIMLIINPNITRTCISKTDFVPC